MFYKYRINDYIDYKYKLDVQILNFQVNKLKSLV